MRRSLRLKVGLALFAATVVLLVAQALGVRALAESQEERLIRSVIADDMRDMLRSFTDDPASLPPLDPALRAHVSQEGGMRLTLPASFANLGPGVHEVLVDGREVHVAVATVRGKRLYRLYDYSAYERHFRDGLDALVVGTAMFVLPAIGIAFWLSGLLVRQVAGLGRQVQALRSGVGSAIDPASYDEREVAELADAVNAYHARMATMIEREKEFTANVSHELRTPLTAIRTSCELLEPVAGSLDAKARQRLHQIEQAADHMHALVECLLALGREDAADAAPIALAAFVATALGRYADRMERQAVRATLDIDAGATVVADAAGLGIVLSNLIDNALRHTEQGLLRLSYEHGLLCIEDSGSGIVPEALPHVFERFYRAPGARADGHGIGLAIVKKICDRQGWPVGVTSGPGAGTRVTLGLAAGADALHENFTKA